MVFFRSLGSLENHGNDCSITKYLLVLVVVQKAGIVIQVRQKNLIDSNFKSILLYICIYEKHSAIGNIKEKELI